MAGYEDEKTDQSHREFLNMASVRCRFTFKNFKEIKKLRNLTIKFKDFSSHEWLKRRDNDLYIEKAKKENYRCRSAFKLIEINEKYNLIKPGFNVLDVGAAPGSWSQVLAKYTNSNENDPNAPKGLVIAIDLSSIQKIPGVTILQQMNFTKKSSQDKILEVLENKQLDFVVSDMAPPATGVKSLDQENIIRLVYPVLIFSVENLRPGGGCLIKIWEGQHQKIIEDMKKFFKYFNIVKPSASYSSSAETYILGREFLGLKR